MFLSDGFLQDCTWQAFERAVQRLLLHLGFEGVRLVGQSGDEGADVLGHKFGKRWLFQVKYWGRKVAETTVDETLRACSIYRADIPVIVSLKGFEASVDRRRDTLQRQGVPLQLWNARTLQDRLATCSTSHMWTHPLRDYQERAVETIVSAFLRGERHALVVLATGLGKTVIAAEAIRRIRMTHPEFRSIVLAHTNPIVYQLERAFWPFLDARIPTVVWNGYERPESLRESPFTFASVQTVFEYFDGGGDALTPDIVLVDECHHAASDTYVRVLDELLPVTSTSGFLLGLTATPWRADGRDLASRFGEPLVKVDMVEGMRGGYLANVDYRMYTDNIKWGAISQLGGPWLTPAAINRTLFISEWDDGVVGEIALAWTEQPNPRAIVFCGSVDHAITMRDRVNQRGFAKAAALYSAIAGRKPQSAPERARILADFFDGTIGVVCAVDVLNEGVDIPDVNIVVFQRVTHSRRIFVQQLGRGLRLSPGKDRVIVLDFVSDIRRFAAGLALKDQLAARPPSDVRRVSVNHVVTFRRVGGADPSSERFLRTWLEDVTAIEEAGEDVAMLKFPPVVEAPCR